MFTSTTPRCPSWCNGEHLTTNNDDNGFHHDAEQWSLLPANQDHTGGDAYVFVNAAQFVPADGEPCPAIVELTPDNGPIVRLTPSEAFELALALLVAAKTAHQR